MFCSQNFEIAAEYGLLRQALRTQKWFRKKFLENFSLIERNA
jgi:hypothetical protein